MKFWTIISLSFGLALAASIGCGDDDDAGTDAGTDGDSDSDSDSDGDTDTSPVSCGGLPVTCDDIGSGWDELTYGCCWDNTVYWCGLTGEEEWVMQSQSCDELDMTCAHSEADGYVWCI